MPKIRELERALGRKTMEVEILRAAQEVEKNAVVAQSVRAVTGRSMTAICAVLGIARRTAYYVARARPDGRQQEEWNVLIDLIQSGRLGRL